MGEILYAPLIDDMVWSYSRLQSFRTCPYKWYLSYIKRIRGKEMFFSGYGSFLHHLLEQYYTGAKSRDALVEEYLLEFRKTVRGKAPNQKIFRSYFNDGLAYLKSLEPFPYNVIGVEKKVRFDLDGIPFVGYIDFLGEQDGDLYVIDHKSRALRPRSGRASPTQSDRELDSYLRQLYLYSIAVEREFGKRPKFLCFNCFRSGTLIREPFDEVAAERAKQWALDEINLIRETSDFRPEVDYFKCKHLCERNDQCEYFALMNKRR